MKRFLILSIILLAWAGEGWGQTGINVGDTNTAHTGAGDWYPGEWIVLWGDTLQYRRTVQDGDTLRKGYAKTGAYTGTARSMQIGLYEWNGTQADSLLFMDTITQVDVSFGYDSTGVFAYHPPTGIVVIAALSPIGTAPTDSLRVGTRGNAGTSNMRECVNCVTGLAQPFDWSGTGAYNNNQRYMFHFRGDNTASAPTLRVGAVALGAVKVAVP